MKEKVKPEEILCRVNAQYEEETLFHAHVYDWQHTFCTGCKKISNLLHAYVQSTAVCNVNNHHVEELILRSSFITVHDTASSSTIIVESVEPIIHKNVFFKKVSTWWSPKMLSFDKKVQGVAMSAKHLNQFKLESKTFLE
jgi:hypothetical protein